MNQTILAFATDFIPEAGHEACYINNLVESMFIKEDYVTGRPREYNLRGMLKLVLFAYLRGRFTCRSIEREGHENRYAQWLTQEQVPSYRTIARFIVSDEAETLIQSGFETMREFLVTNKLVDDAVFIDGTKILANANKYSFVWKKNVIRFDNLNREKATALIEEIKAVENQALEDSLPMDYEQLDLILGQLENWISQLDAQVEETKKVSPNPAKQKRRKAKFLKHKLDHCLRRRDQYATDRVIMGERNSYSKTDHDATFMRVK